MTRLVAGAIGLLVMAGAARAQEDEAGIPLGHVPPAATVERLDGTPVPLDQLTRAKPALIEFWATWCPRCRALEPRLTHAEELYGRRVQFLAVAVAVNETLAAVRRHLAAHPAPYPFLWDADGAAVRAFQAPTTSFMVLLGKDGQVLYTGVGPEQDFESALARVTAAP